MPIYKYRREDGSTFEITHSIKDKLEKCPDTGQKVTRLIIWEGQTIIRGWSPDKERKKKDLANKPGVTTLPEYQKKIDANTEKAREMKAKARDNA